MGGKQITCMSTWKENLTGIYQLLTKMLLSHWNPFNPPRSSCLEIQWWKMCSLLLERLIRRSSSGNLTYCKSNGPTESNGMSWQGKEEICIISSLALIIQWKGILWEDQGRVPGQRSAVEQTCAWCVWTSVATFRTTPGRSLKDWKTLNIQLKTLLADSSVAADCKDTLQIFQRGHFLRKGNVT